MFTTIWQCKLYTWQERASMGNPGNIDRIAHAHRVHSNGCLTSWKTDFHLFFIHELWKRISILHVVYAFYRGAFKPALAGLWLTDSLLNVTVTQWMDHSILINFSRSKSVIIFECNRTLIKFCSVGILAMAVFKIFSIKSIFQKTSINRYAE